MIETDGKQVLFFDQIYVIYRRWKVIKNGKQIEHVKNKLSAHKQDLLETCKSSSISLLFLSVTTSKA